MVGEDLSVCMAQGWGGDVGPAQRRATGIVAETAEARAAAKGRFPSTRPCECTEGAHILPRLPACPLQRSVSLGHELKSGTGPSPHSRLLLFWPQHSLWLALLSLGGPGTAIHAVPWHPVLFPALLSSHFTGLMGEAQD